MVVFIFGCCGIEPQAVTGTTPFKHFTRHPDLPLTSFYSLENSQGDNLFSEINFSIVYTWCFLEKQVLSKEFSLLRLV